MSEKRTTPTVLVLDDDPIIGEKVRVALEHKLGVVAIIVYSPSDAAATLARTPSIEMLVTDFMLPRINGDQVIKQVKRRYPSMKFIAMSGSWLDSTKAAVQQVGAHAIVSKVDLEFYKQPAFDAIRAVLDGPQPAKEAQQ